MELNKSRKNKKNKGYRLLYPLESLPQEYTLKQIKQIQKITNFCFYDGSKSKYLKPKLLHLGGNKNIKLKSTKLIDISKIKNQ